MNVECTREELEEEARMNTINLDLTNVVRFGVIDWRVENAHNCAYQKLSSTAEEDEYKLFSAKLN